MMNPWELLKISPTNDLRQIKKAYAEQLKIFHPEEYPERFEALQEAYHTALYFAKHNFSSGQNAFLTDGTLNQSVPAESAQPEFKEFYELDDHSPTLNLFDKEWQFDADDSEQFKLKSGDKNDEQLEQKYSEIEQYNRYVETVQQLNELARRFVMLCSRQHRLWSTWKNKRVKAELQDIKNEFRATDQEILQKIHLANENKNELTERYFQTLSPAMQKLLRQTQKDRGIDKKLLNRIAGDLVKNLPRREPISTLFALLMIAFAISTILFLADFFGISLSNSSSNPNHYTTTSNSSSFLSTTSISDDYNSYLNWVNSYLQGLDSDTSYPITLYPSQNSDGTYTFVTSNDGNTESSTD